MNVWLLLLEDPGRVVYVEPRQVLRVKQWSSISIWGSKHRSQQATSASARDDIEVVCKPRI